MSLRKRVLLADDDPAIVWGVGRVLTRAGFKVVTCGDGTEALALLQSQSFELLVTDIQMPKLSGLALIDWARENCPRLRVVVITAYGSPTIKELSVRKGAILYMEKPVDPVTLVEVLKSSGRCDSFAGNISDIDLFDYIQLMLVTRRQVVVEVVSGQQGNGRLYIDQGNVTHATCGELSGVEALFACLLFEGGAFSTLPWQPPEEVTIHEPGEHLLLEAARRKDEIARDQQGEAPAASQEPDGFDNLWSEFE